ncbi:MAG: ABC transporter ATP-binding protein [Synergistaceae bacterium]|nr:ABC transporter ATP-binding protein [Synergistaceae bacterium]
MKNKNTFKRLLNVLEPGYRLKLFIAVLFMLASSGLNILPPWLFKSVVDDVLISRDFMKLNLICVAIIVIFSLKAFTTYWQHYLMTEVGQSVVMDVRIKLYDHMQRMPLKKLYASRVGELMSRITGDVSMLQHLMTNTFINLVFNGMTFLGMFAFILYLNWKLTLFIILVLPVVAWLLSFASKKLRRAGHTVQERLADLTSVAQEAFSAIRVVRAFATEDQETLRFKRGNLENFKALLHAVSIQELLAGVIEVFLICALAVVFWFGGQNVINGDLTPGELISFIGYIAFMVQPIRTIMNQMSNFQTGLAAADRIFDMLDTQVESENSGGEILKLKGDIKFKNICFNYNQDVEVLKNINLEIRRGENVALVGPTGSGKSTLADLIPRFYEPTSGQILLDDVNARDLDLKNLRRQIGIVPQECVLMKGSIAFNIAYGLCDDGDELFNNLALMQKIKDAAKIADIDEFIESQPDKYKTEVGERGLTLSGGQRQRIAIARAIVRDPVILILDEATSSLDAAVERQVQNAMDRAMTGRTSLIIAHRLSTIRNANRIIVLEDGKIIQAGTHDELIKSGGLYAELYKLQS